MAAGTLSVAFQLMPTIHAPSLMCGCAHSSIIPLKLIENQITSFRTFLVGAEVEFTPTLHHTSECLQRFLCTCCLSQQKHNETISAFLHHPTSWLWWGECSWDPERRVPEEIRGSGGNLGASCVDVSSKFSFLCNCYPDVYIFTY